MEVYWDPTVRSIASYNAISLGVFDPITKTFSTIDISATFGTSVYKYVGSIVAGNDRIC